MANLSIYEIIYFLCAVAKILIYKPKQWLYLYLKKYYFIYNIKICFSNKKMSILVTSKLLSHLIEIVSLVVEFLISYVKKLFYYCNYPVTEIRKILLIILTFLYLKNPKKKAV